MYILKYNASLLLFEDFRTLGNAKIYKRQTATLLMGSVLWVCLTLKPKPGQCQYLRDNYKYFRNMFLHSAF